MALDRRRLLLSSARLAAWWAVFDLGQTGRAWAGGGFDLDARGWAKELTRSAARCSPIIPFRESVAKLG
ncbi:MAG TPA: hypothetical protein VFA20_14615 [Myxococcaceae bacterium]|nr:hypothetical protein [Myxococcaceae bacterium]